MTFILISALLLSALIGVITCFTVYSFKKTGICTAVISAGLLAMNILFALLIMNSEM